MPQLYVVTVPGIDVKSDWTKVHDRLLDDFPDVTDVLATTISATVTIVYQGPAEIDAWFDRITDTILSRRMRVGWSWRHASTPTLTETSATSRRSPSPSIACSMARPPTFSD